MCAIAAPARAASIAAAAICSGVTGTSGLRPAVSPAPVTAQVMNTSQFTTPPETRWGAMLPGPRGGAARPTMRACVA